MLSQRLSIPLIWTTLLPIVQGRAQRKLRGGLQPYRRRSVISQEYLTRWIAHLRTSIPRQRCWTCPTCKTANLKPSNVILSSACGNLGCCLKRLKISWGRSIRGQEDIPKCADVTACNEEIRSSRNISKPPIGKTTGRLDTTSRRP